MDGIEAPIDVVSEIEAAISQQVEVAVQDALGSRQDRRHVFGHAAAQDLDHAGRVLGMAEEAAAGFAARARFAAGIQAQATQQDVPVFAGLLADTGTNLIPTHTGEPGDG